ncbi:MAG TPA: Coenzyme F420 hydrogenase/dehydrogenase, beta subunit C-terminal domain [Microthrixaceae bacterium]|jgi:coenzyme F420 hydrogenase subunit beta|nr:Coenzyme F420 hydrogenase/dehydrogenase, beta subunit C-terminal domain [Microthrixaceae bacterium]
MSEADGAAVADESAARNESGAAAPVAALTLEERLADAQSVRWTNQWAELKAEVIDTDLCTGCAGCVISCPHDVIGYDHSSGGYRPFHLEDELGPDDCVHGQKGCTTCTRACPRFRLWEAQADEHLFGTLRQPDEVAGKFQDILLTRASDEHVNQTGQDGGLVSAILLWAMEHDYIDAALVSYLEGGNTGSWKAVPGVAATPEEILAAAGSRYTYSANTLALDEAIAAGHSRLALVGMSCQSSVPPVMWSRKAGKISKPIVFNLGLLCSKTFDDAIFEELFWAKYGLAREHMVKMNIKGVFQIWMDDGAYHEINLKECHAWTREGCNHCPDFAAEHADISCGGIGENANWTLTIVRTDLGREIITRMIDQGVIEARPGDSDPGAIALMRKLAEKSRSRWPTTAEPAVRVGLPEPKVKSRP